MVENGPLANNPERNEPMKTMTRKEITTARRARHNAALATLHASPATADGLKIWRKLRKIETEAHDSATAQCNGAAFRNQPYRPDYLPDGSEGQDTPWEAYAATVRTRVAAAFGGKLPQGFRLNQDARGYALKIDPDKGPVPDGMEMDWGGNGLLAAEIE